MFTGRTFLLFFIALLLAIGAVLVAQRWVASLGGGPAKQVQYGKIVVAALDIPQWSKVEAAQIKEVDWPKDAVTSDMFTEKSQVYGKVAVDNVYSGEPLNARRVLDPKGGNVFSLQIPENKRAFTIRVNDVSGVGGFLLPDNHVDVLATRKASGTNDKVTTETLVQDIKVLAVDQEAGKDKNKPVIVRSVTLEMTPQEAEAVFRAGEEGSIQLALRNPTDDNPVMRTVAHAPIESPRPEPRAAASAPSGKVFTVIRGMSSSQLLCQGSGCSDRR